MYVGLIQFFGIVGVFLVLYAYLLLQLNKFEKDDLRFVLINAIGSILILITFTVQWNLASFLIEVAWLLISLFGLARIIKRKRSDASFEA